MQYLIYVGITDMQIDTCFTTQQNLYLFHIHTAWIIVNVLNMDMISPGFIFYFTTTKRKQQFYLHLVLYQNIMPVISFGDACNNRLSILSTL